MNLGKAELDEFFRRLAIIVGSSGGGSMKAGDLIVAGPSGEPVSGMRGFEVVDNAAALPDISARPDGSRVFTRDGLSYVHRSGYWTSDSLLGDLFEGSAGHGIAKLRELQGMVTPLEIAIQYLFTGVDAFGRIIYPKATILTLSDNKGWLLTRDDDPAVYRIEVQATSGYVATPSEDNYKVVTVDARGLADWEAWTLAFQAALNGAGWPFGSDAYGGDDIRAFVVIEILSSGNTGGTITATFSLPSYDWGTENFTGGLASLYDLRRQSAIMATKESLGASVASGVIFTRLVRYSYLNLSAEHAGQVNAIFTIPADMLAPAAHFVGAKLTLLSFFSDAALDDLGITFSVGQLTAGATALVRGFPVGHASGRSPGDMEDRGDAGLMIADPTKEVFVYVSLSTPGKTFGDLTSGDIILQLFLA